MAAARGDIAALFEAEYDALLRFAIRRVGADTAADVVAEVFLVTWRRRDDLPPVAQRRPWLFGIAHKVILNQARSAQRQDRVRARLQDELAVTPAGAGDRVGADADADAGADVELVRAALARLRPDEQETLRLTEWDELSVADAAAVVGCSRGTFRVRLHRARRHLAAEVQRADTDVSPFRDEVN